MQSAKKKATHKKLLYLYFEKCMWGLLLHFQSYYTCIYSGASVIQTLHLDAFIGRNWIFTQLNQKFTFQMVSFNYMVLKCIDNCIIHLDDNLFFLKVSLKLYFFFLARCKLYRKQPMLSDWISYLGPVKTSLIRWLSSAHVCDGMPIKRHMPTKTIFCQFLQYLQCVSC